MRAAVVDDRLPYTDFAPRLRQWSLGPEGQTAKHGPQDRRNSRKPHNRTSEFGSGSTIRRVARLDPISQLTPAGLWLLSKQHVEPHRCPPADVVHSLASPACRIYTDLVCVVGPPSLLSARPWHENVVR